MLIKTENRREAYQALINTLLKDNTRYCNTCGKNYNINHMPCCEDPQIGTNLDITKAVIEQNKWLRETAANDYASTKDKTLRFGISVPQYLYAALDNYERKYGRKFLTSDADVVWFAKNFPQFAIPRRV